MEDSKGPQAMNEDQHLQELRQRINAKAENLGKVLSRRPLQQKGKRKWISIVAIVVILVVFLAALVRVQVDRYGTDDFWKYNMWLGVFIGVFVLVYYIMSMIMRHFLTKMKNATTAPQQYREVKRLITTYQLRSWIPIAAAFVCGVVFKYVTDYEIDWVSIIFVIFLILGAMMSVWYFDEDFYYDVKELGKYE